MVIQNVGEATQQMCEFYLKISAQTLDYIFFKSDTL